MNPNQNSASVATVGGQNPGNSAAAFGQDGLNALAMAVEQFESPAALDTPSTQTTSAAEPDPSPTAEPAEQTDTGEILPAEETPEGEEPEGEGESETVLSQSDPLAELDNETREHALELARLIKSGELKPGELPRINKLIGQKHEAEEAKAREVAELKAEIETLKSGNAVQPASHLPPEIAKLKSPQEIGEREMALKRFTMWAQRNRDGGVYNGTEFTAEDVNRAWEQADEQLLVLPQRREQLQAEAQFKEQRKTVSAQVRKDFPILDDAENPITKVARQLLNDPQIASRPNAEYIALALAKGDAVLKAELSARKAPKAAARQEPRPTGGIAKAKPASGGGGGAVAGPRAGASLNKVLERVEKERSVGSLADLISAQK